MRTRETRTRNAEPEHKKSSIIAPIVVGVVIALVAGTSAPWWWSLVFPSKQHVSPIIINRSGRLHRIASNDHCSGDERSWVYITNDYAIKIGLVGVNLTENRIDIRVQQTNDGRTTELPEIHSGADFTVPIGVGKLQIYIKPRIDDCWVDYEISERSDGQVTPPQGSTVNWTAIGVIGGFVLTISGWFVVDLLTKRRERQKEVSVPRHTPELRLPNGSLFTDAQFHTYRGVWVALQELREAGDALWTRASQENLDTFVRALRVAYAQVAGGAIFFHHDDYEQLTALLQHFANYRIGKEHLIDMQTRREGGGPWDPWVEEDAQRQIRENHEHLKRYTALLDKIRTTYHDRLSWERYTP
jgi:hypothetical protein